MMYMIAPWQKQCLTRHAVSQKLGHRLELQYVPIDAAESKMSEQKKCSTHIETHLASFPFNIVKYRSSHIGQLLWSAIPASLSMLCQHMVSHTDHVIFVMKHHLWPIYFSNPKFRWPENQPNGPMETDARMASSWKISEETPPLKTRQGDTPNSERLP